jgi:selenocysteine lyase/cysteine desulfurase
VGRDAFRIRDDARRFENWESNIAAKLGMGAAVDYALVWGLDRIWGRVQYLAALLRGLDSIPGVPVRDKGVTRCGIVPFTVAGRAAAAIQDWLTARDMNVSWSSVASTRHDMEAWGLPAVVRASVHYYNSEEEIAQACDLLRSLVSESA